MEIANFQGWGLLIAPPPARKHPFLSHPCLSWRWGGQSHWIQSASPGTYCSQGRGASST